MRKVFGCMTRAARPVKYGCGSGWELLNTHARRRTRLPHATDLRWSVAPPPQVPIDRSDRPVAETAGLGHQRDVPRTNIAARRCLIVQRPAEPVRLRLYQSPTGDAGG